MTDQERKKFINQIANYAIKYAPKYGIKVVSPIIAQACKESAFGTSNKAKYHNYFGLKYRNYRVTCNNGYFQDTSSEQNPDGSYITLPNSTKWYKFDTMEAGVEGYFQFINTNNYAACKGVTDPETYLKALKEAGYATSLTYVTSCMNDYIKKYNLTIYDKKLIGGNNNMFKVALDAGHGSNTAGKRHPDGYREHYSNTYIAYYVDQILTKNGIETFKSSWDDAIVTDDTDIVLGTRQKNIKNAGCDICVSIHANAFGDGKSYNNADGVETFYHSNNAYINDSAKLATCIQNELIKGTAQNNRGVKRSALAMCNATVMNVKAAVLIETAFMTNKRESDLLKDDNFIRECAREISQGIFNYLGVSGNVNVSLQGISGNNTSNSDTSSSTTTPAKPTVSGINFKAGDSFKLTNTTFYSSSNGSTGSKRTGTYYAWSNEVVNGRVRMTNVANRVGITGQVTGWVNVSDLGITTVTESKPSTNTTPSSTVNNNLVVGSAIKLSAVTFYASANATSGNKKSGTYYVWSNEVVNGRVRMTNAKARVGVSGQVTGWVNVSDLGINNGTTTLKAGDIVKLEKVALFGSSTTAAGSLKSGTYYVWSSEVVNGRIRLTNTKARVGVAGQVSGWVNVKDL